MITVKKYFFLVFICLFNHFANAQINRVIYKNGFYGNDINKSVLTKEKKDKLGQFGTDFIEQMQKTTASIEFELFYDKNISIFKKIEALNVNDDKMVKAIELGFSDVYYKNNIEKEKLVLDQKTRGLINIKKDFEEYKWEITSENRIISGYKCFKATTIKQDIYNPIKKTANIFNITAWFTPDIPSNFGPKGIDGLPGLVLEASENGKIYIYAAKIEFDIKKQVKIEKPECDKTITEKEFEVILSENFKKMQDEMGN